LFLRKQNLGSNLFIAICVVDFQKKDSEIGKLKELSVSVSSPIFLLALYMRFCTAVYGNYPTSYPAKVKKKRKTWLFPAWLSSLAYKSGWFTCLSASLVLIPSVAHENAINIRINDVSLAFITHFNSFLFHEYLSPASGAEIHMHPEKFFQPF
jgi:hypothetical protein